MPNLLFDDSLLCTIRERIPEILEKRERERERKIKKRENGARGRVDGVESKTAKEEA